ncbi:MAG: hypothetical protein LBO77_03645 [Desulfovibrio sp.]|jgi:hypothetical protein|nr:hypothetical protein [Desulfovibrio sp.]
MCTTSPHLPQVNYGQSKGAWNPGKRDEVYRQIERARSDAAFANLFASDILFGKPEGKYYYQETETGLERTKAAKNGYLYNENSLNAAKSWVAQAFGVPAMRGEDGAWYKASPLLKPPSFASKAQTQYGYTQGGRITDAQTLRLLNEGHFAFSARGYNGSEVYVPWAEGFAPGKGGRGKPEAGDAKKESRAGKDPGMAVGAARPGTVLGDPEDLRTLMGGRGKTLLGGE